MDGKTLQASGLLGIIQPSSELFWRGEVAGRVVDLIVVV